MRISIWSHPRSRSTALERYFGNRGDVRTAHERLADYYYVHRAAEPIEHAAIGGLAGSSYDEVAAELTAPGAGTLVHKDFPYHAIDELLADPRWLDAQHVVLVRDPRETIYSHLQLRPGLTDKNLGYADLGRWHDHLLRHGAPVHVVESGDLNDRPAATLAALCAAVGLDFDERHLHWAPEMLADWRQWGGWHADVGRSRGLGRPAAVPPGWSVPADLADVRARAQAVYERVLGQRAGLVTEHAS